MEDQQQHPERQNIIMAYHGHNDKLYEFVIPQGYAKELQIIPINHKKRASQAHQEENPIYGNFEYRGTTEFIPGQETIDQLRKIHLDSLIPYNRSEKYQKENQTKPGTITEKAIAV